jgi:hypothetical protein
MSEGKRSDDERWSGGQRGARPDWRAGTSSASPRSTGFGDDNVPAEELGGNGAPQSKTGQLRDLAKKTAAEQVEMSGSGASGSVAGRGQALRDGASRSRSQGVKQTVKHKGTMAARNAARNATAGLSEVGIFGYRLAKIVVPAAISTGLALLLIVLVVVFGGAFDQGSITYALSPGAADAIPASYLAAYQAAGAQYNVPWTVLAGIGQVATKQGRTAPSDIADYGKALDRSPYATSSTSVSTTTIPNASTTNTTIHGALGYYQAGYTNCGGDNCTVEPAIGIKDGEGQGPLLLDPIWLSTNAGSSNPQSINDAAMLLAGALSNIRDSILNSDSSDQFSDYQSSATAADALWEAVVTQAPVDLPSGGAAGAIAVGAALNSSASSSGATEGSTGSSTTITASGLSGADSTGSWVNSVLAQCPTQSFPNTVRGTSLSIHQICEDSVKQAATQSAALAVVAAMHNLGLKYSEEPYRNTPGWSDCSSFVSRMYEFAGVGIDPEQAPGTTIAPDAWQHTNAPTTFVISQAAWAIPEARWQVRPGDLLETQNEQHVVMVLADGLIAENSGTGDVSHIDPLWFSSTLYFRIDPSKVGQSPRNTTSFVPGSGAGANVQVSPDAYLAIEYAIEYGGDFPGDSRAGTLVLPSGAADSASSATKTQVTALIHKYWPAKQWDNALRVASCESGLEAGAVGTNTDGTQDIGIFQLNTGGTLQELLTRDGFASSDLNQALDADWNVKMAAVLWSERGWEPWSCAKSMAIVVQNAAGQWVPGPGDSSGAAG